MTLLILTLVLGLLAITLHELGHYEAMRRCGVPVSEVSLLGFPVPWLPSLRITRGETVWSIHTLLLGAYVKPRHPESIEQLPLHQQLYINGNGIVVNIAYAFTLVGAHALITSYTSAQPSYSIGGIICIACASIIWFSRRLLVYVIPILGIMATWLIVTELFAATPMQSMKAGNGGPVAVVVLLGSAHSIQQALHIAAAVSLCLALMNALPLVPLDGGNIVYAILKKGCNVPERFLSMYQTGGICAALCLIVYMLGLDVLRIGTWAFDWIRTMS